MFSKRLMIYAAFAACTISLCAHAQRLPVLRQIDLPHPYYYREMYLPQLTSGPSSLAWSPDSRELIVSMAGSLWRLALGVNEAQQLTASAGYDYQPDWSKDGRWVVYSSYRNDAVELWALDLKDGTTRALTSNNAVNVEPRFSPDGKRIVFVSTQYNGHFHVFAADFVDGKLINGARLTGEHKSDLPRYYYSAYDHEISPIWAADGHDIIYVSNRDHIYGTGGLWRSAASAGSQAKEIHYEETNWKARPDLSPDGSRLVFSSYTGREWHNLWVMPAAGGDAFPIAYGDWDQTNARWAPDGARIAFISNRHGSTEICIERVPGGLVEELPPARRKYLLPMTRLHLQVQNGNGAPGAARISVVDGAGRFYAPADAWISADDGFDRHQQPFEAHYFHVRGDAWIDVPVGLVHVDVLHGFERAFEQRSLRMTAEKPESLLIDLQAGRWSVPDSGQWLSADVHVHMNYGGVYRNTPAHLALQAEAEDLRLVNSLIVNKEQRFPDIAFNGRQLDGASLSDATVVHGQEYHTSYWGHLGLLHIADGIVLPGYAGYPNTAAASLYPMNADVADIAHARGAVVGYVHPFDSFPEPITKPTESLTSELPIDIALGKVDYMEILGFSDHRATAAVWYRLLNLGYRIPAAGGTDAMANYASLRGPVGMNRVYARTSGDGTLRPADWFEALKRGRTFATNGPLLGFQLGRAAVGDELTFAAPQRAVEFSARLQSIVPVDHLELVCNGKVAKSFIGGKPVAKLSVTGTIALKDSGWCLLRASSDGARYPVLDNYVYATTSPVYVTIGGQQPRSPDDARYFAAWVDRVSETTARYPDWNSAAEQAQVLHRLEEAKAIFTNLE